MQAFAPTSLVVTAPLALVAHKDAPWRSVQDLAAGAKRAPDSDLRHRQPLPPLQRAHAAGGRFQADACPLPLCRPGSARRAGGAGRAARGQRGQRQQTHQGRRPPRARRTPMLPGVRSLARQGFAEFEALGWLALLGRAGTPDQNVRKMSESMSQDLIGTEICERIAVPGGDVVGGRPGAMPPFRQQRGPEVGPGDPLREGDGGLIAAFRAPGGEPRGAGRRAHPCCLPLDEGDGPAVAGVAWEPRVPAPLGTGRCRTAPGGPA